MSSITYGFIFFLLLMITFLVLSRTVKTRSPATILCLSSIIVYFLGIVCLIVLKIFFKFFEFSSSYWFFTFSMMMVFFAVYKSISLKMMLNLKNSPATLDQILSNYIQQESYKVRLNILLDNGFAEKSSEGYQLTLKGQRYAMIVSAVQKIFSIQKSG